MGGAAGVTGGRGGQDAAGGMSGADAPGGMSGTDAGQAGSAGRGCMWPTVPYPVSGFGFEAYEGVLAVEYLTPTKECPGAARDEVRIENGRFDLSVSGYGSVMVFLDTSGDRLYQKSEPDWTRSSSTVTVADFDASKDFHVEITEMPSIQKLQLVHLAFCTNPDAVYGSPNGETCVVQRLALGTYLGSFRMDTSVESTNVSWAIWLTDFDSDSWPFDRSRPHFIGSLTKPPCTVDGDFTTCSLSFADLVKGDAGTDGADDGGADGAVDADASASK